VTKTPKETAPRAPSRWGRLLLWILALFLVLVVAAVFWIRAFLDDPQPILATAARQFGQELQLDNLDFSFLPSGRLVLRDVRLRETGQDRDYVQIDYLELQWDYRNLRRRVVDELRVHGIRLWLNRMPQAASSGKKQKLVPFTLKRLILGQATLMLEGLGEGIPPIPVKIGEVDPMVLNDLQLGGSTSDPAARELQTARAFNIGIKSPLDPLAPVLFFEEIEFQFSWAGIQEKQIDKMSIKRPVIYVGEDLFWFVNLIRENNVPPALDKEGEPEKIGPEPWSLTNFSILGGRVTITTFGRPGLTLPLTFATRAESLVLENFNELALDIECDIPTTDLDYPEYNLRIVGMRGDLEFSLPPGKDANNVVQTIYFNSLLWRDIALTEAYISMTFDMRGLFAKFGGYCGTGYVGGDLSVFSDRGFEWVASAYASEVAAGPISERLSPENVTLDGIVDGTFVVSGEQKEIRRCYGNVDFATPGELTITAVDDLIGRLPDHWNAVKKELSRVSLDTFRSYRYDQGTCEFNYAPPKSFVQLRMDGAQGTRNFDVRWLDLRENPTLAW
jgi:hypothetical protein